MGNQLVWSMGSRVREGMCTILCVLLPYFLFYSKFQLCWTTIWQAPHDFISLLVCLILRIWFLLHYSWNLIFQSLASQVRKQLHGSRMEGKPVEGFNHSTSSLLARYLAVRPFAMSSFPILTITTKFISKEKKNWKHLHLVYSFCRSSHPPLMTVPCCRRCSLRCSTF